MSLFFNILLVINALVILYFIILNGSYIYLSIVSFFHIRKYKDIDRIFKLEGVYSTQLYKPVSIIAPAYNEEQSIISSVNSLLNLRYANFEVVVVNDGSTDATLQKLIDNFNSPRINAIARNTSNTSRYAASIPLIASPG